MKTVWGLLLVGGLCCSLMFGNMIAQTSMAKSPGVVAMYGLAGAISVIAFFVGAVKFSRG